MIKSVKIDINLQLQQPYNDSVVPRSCTTEQFLTCPPHTTTDHSTAICLSRVSSGCNASSSVHYGAEVICLMNIAKFINVIEDESSTRHSSHFAQQEYARAGSPASLTMCRINARVRGTESEGCNIQCQTSIAYSSYTTIVIHSNTLVWVKSHISLT